jgi:intracellular multiplication protein IcmQ
MTDKLSKEQLVAIVLAIDKTIDEGPWSASAFLSLIGKKLKSIRDNIADHVDAHQDSASGYDKADSRNSERFSTLKKVCISLYAFDGSNLQSWERILEHLPVQTTSRPIYENEEDVNTIIRTKANRLNEAYAVVYIDPLNILKLPPERTQVDKLGKPLLSLKDKAITQENIELLVHETGQYRYVGGKLIKK